MEYTGIIKSYELNKVIIGSIIFDLPWAIVDEQKKKYPVGTKVRIETRGCHIISMIDAPVYQPFEQTTLTRLYIEQNTQAEAKQDEDSDFDISLYLSETIDKVEMKG